MRVMLSVWHLFVVPLLQYIEIFSRKSLKINLKKELRIKIKLIDKKIKHKD